MATTLVVSAACAVGPPTDPVEFSANVTGGARGSTSLGASSLPSRSGFETEEDVECRDRCIPKPPEGWVGPVARVFFGPDADTGTSCGGDWPVEDATLIASVDAGIVKCSCECQGQAGTCEDHTVVTASLLSSCVGGESHFIDNVTKALPTGLSDRYWSMSGGTTPPSCSGKPNIAVAPPDVDERVRLCAPQSLPASDCGDDSLCFAEPNLPFEGSICVWRDGRHECPSEFPEVGRYYRSFADQRTCSECDCQPDSTQACVERSIEFRTASAGIIGPAYPTFLSPGECRRYAGGPGHADLEPGTPRRPTCSPSQASVPVGSVEMQLPVTVCCRHQ